MTTKQAVILALMVFFLGVALVTLGLWFRASLELHSRKATLRGLEDQKKDLAYQRDQLRLVLQDPEHPGAGLSDRLDKARQDGQAHLEMVYTGPPNVARYSLYEEKERDLADKYGRDVDGRYEEGAAAKAWKAVYEEWKKQDAQIEKAEEALRTQEKNSATQVDTANQELKTQLEEEEKQRREAVVKRKKWEEDLAKDRAETEDVQDKISKVTRELEKPAEQERDGEVLFSDPDLKLVTVDLGYLQGAKAGLKFDVFSGRHNVPVKKGQIQLSAIRATSADGVILPEQGPRRYDPTTGWQAPDPTMRYSVYGAGGPQGTEPQRLEPIRSKKEIMQEQHAEKMRLEQGGDTEAPAAATGLSREAPIVLSKDFEPIAAGDWIANSEFVRIIPEGQFRKQARDDLLAMSDVGLGTLTFYFADDLKPFRREFLQRLCERNRCKTARQMSAEVDYVVTLPNWTRLDLLEERIRDVPEEKRANEAELTPEKAEIVRVVKVLREARKYDARAVSEDQLEDFFVSRQRKSELLKGSAIQAGQRTFYVVGETRQRSVRETGLWIQEHGGVLAPRLDASVDYLVVGGGLGDAKWDKATNKLYYAGQDAPAAAVPFYDAVRTMGLKILREEELPAFFGRQK